MYSHYLFTGKHGYYSKKWNLYHFWELKVNKRYYRGTYSLCHSSVIIFSSKTFFFNLFTWPPLCIASSCAKLAEAEMKQYSSLWEHQSELSCHNPSPNARGLILSRRQRNACAEALVMRTCSQIKPLHKGQLSTIATAFCPKMFTMERFDSILSDNN